MNRVQLGCALAALALVAGCGLGSHVVDPGDRIVSGVVQYPAGAAAARALVTSESGTETFTDGSGRFKLRVPADREVTIRARDGFDGRAYAETHAGSIVIAREEGSGGHVIVLDQSFPI